MVRKTPGEPVHRLKELDGADIRRKCARWVADNASELREADPAVPPELHDRAADNWRPLLAIVDLVSGEWSKRARTAAKALSEGDDDTESYAVMLLADIRDLFADRGTDRLSSKELGRRAGGIGGPALGRISQGEIPDQEWCRKVA